MAKRSCSPLHGDRKCHCRQSFSGRDSRCRLPRKVSYHAFGKLSYDKDSPAVKLDTMYDLASLTNVVVTTTLVEKLVEGDFPSPLDLDAPTNGIFRMGQRPATRMAAQGHRSQSDDSHFRSSSFQGILAHLDRQARHSQQNFCGTPRIEPGHQGRLLRPWHHPHGRDY